MEGISENGDERQERPVLVRQISSITLPKTTVWGFVVLVLLWLAYMTAGFLWLYWEHVRMVTRTPPEDELETEIMTRVSHVGRVASKSFRRVLDSVPFLAVGLSFLFDNAWMAHWAEKFGMVLGTMWTTFAPFFYKVVRFLPSFLKAVRFVAIVRNLKLVADAARGFLNKVRTADVEVTPPQLS